MNRAIPVACGLLVGLTGVAGCAASHPSAQSPAAAPTGVTSPQPYVITTQATGKATAAPDSLDVTIGVDTQAETARAALSANNTKMTALEKKFKSRGVLAKDLQSAGLSIQPTYAQDGSAITGYEVTDMVQATLRNVKTAGGLIDAAVATVGNAVRIDQLSFSASDDSAVNARARADAVTRAQLQAQQIAKASGATLGRIRMITEQLPQQGQPIMDAAVSLPAAKSVPILAGQLTVNVAIQITYDIT